MNTSSANVLLKNLNIGKLSAKEKASALALLEQRLNDVILDTVLLSLSDEGFQAFKAAVRAGDEEKIAEISAQVPGLAQRIELRLTDEYRLIKAAMS